jgi:hypothetical protein
MFAGAGTVDGRAAGALISAFKLLESLDMVVVAKEKSLRRLVFEGLGIPRSVSTLDTEIRDARGDHDTDDTKYKLVSRKKPSNSQAR